MASRIRKNLRNRRNLRIAFIMYSHERLALERIAAALPRFGDRIVGFYAFGSRVRGTHGAWSDFDVLAVVREKDPDTGAEIVSMIVDEETRAGLSFAPLIKDARAFKGEERLRSPLYQNVLLEGVPL